MLLQVCDNPETIRIGIIQSDETKTYIKEQEKDKGFLMGKFTKLPASPYLAESGEKPEEIICTGILTDRGTIKVDLSLLDYFEVGEKVKVTIFLSDQEDPAL